GVTSTYSSQLPGGFGVRSAHNGRILPVVRTGAPVDQVAAYSWTGSRWREVPVQVDERFPYFLANARSDFGFFSGTDQELTYAWAPDRHSTGEEAWKKVFGTCEARYADPATLAADIATAKKAGIYTPGPQETEQDYTHAMADPVAGLDDDDEVALQAGDAGVMAPPGTAAPKGASDGQTVAVADPLDPAGTRYLYLFRKAGGSSFTAATSPVQMQRDADADRWIDRGSFADSDPQKLGTSNTGYGANLPGPVCGKDAAGNDVVVRQSTDRFPSDAMTVTTPAYRLRATGRWMVRELEVRKPGALGRGTGRGQYGADLVDRWKGRAFQQSPDSSISVVGFEDEQVNWEANASLLGWRSGPVRSIREVWGADSGTNVTKTETYYAGADVYRYRVRVHPIPSDGLYTSWDYNRGSVGTYYNLLHPEGVPIDGRNDDTGSIDALPVTGSPAYLDAPDPTFDLPSAVDRPEQVAGTGSNGSLVYVFEFKGATSAVNASAVPYYRDDACLDDGTGDDPVQRPYPGEASTDPRVQQGYAALAGKPYASLACTDKQGAYASHGIHFLATHDSDNATLGVPVTEIDGQQWRYSVPLEAPANVIAQYAPNVVTPLQAVVTPFA
ncbi:MAG: S-layer y protein, partial [Frankiales bacterium]|nr:S-layer y protein [Frankiales bacterium]